MVGDKDVDGNNMQELKKLDAFVNEVLRYRNPALCTILRHVIKDHKLKDLVLKKGMKLSKARHVCIGCDLFDAGLAEAFRESRSI